MTKPEFSHRRDLSFSQWIREKLPDSSSGFMVSDLDFIIYNYKTKKIMLLEVKTFGKKLSTWQRNLFLLLDAALQKGLPKNVQYYGFHLLTFSGKAIEDSIILFDEELITEEELIQKLSF